MSCLTEVAFRENNDFMKQLRFAMYWMPTRQACDFDEWLCMPIRNRAVFTKLSMEYLEYKQSIPAESSNEETYLRFDEFLTNLEATGENVGRFICWFASIVEGHESLGMRPQAEELWIRTLKKWTRDDSLIIRFERAGLGRKSYETYKADVYQIVKHVFQKMKSIAKSWREEPGSYSDFDGYVNRIYYSQLTSGYPAKFFYYEIERQLNREWWRSSIEELSEKQIIGLHNELIDSLSKAGDTELVNWKNAIRIDDAFTINLLPEFNKVARDW